VGGTIALTRNPPFCIQRERPHIVMDEEGDPSFLVSGVTYSLKPTLPTCTIVQPIGSAPH
jgi:hypothetical protein